MKTTVLLLAFSASMAIAQPIAWKQYFTLAPDEGIEFILDSAAIVAGGGVPVLNVARNGRLMLTSAGGAQLKAFEVADDGRTYSSTVIAQRGPDGGFVYLPDGRTRFLSEEPDPTRTPQRHKSRIISWISIDGRSWIRENGIRYQPGLEDDSISSVASVIQVKDSVWRMYFVGDFYRTNGTRTAISYDWGLSWQKESLVNILRRGDVDPHPVYLTTGRIRLYFRMGMNKPPDQAGVGYCDSDDGVRFDTLKIKLLFSDAAIPAMFKLDPCVVKLPSGQVVCYIGAAPFMGQALEPKLIAAWGKKQAVIVEDRAMVVGDIKLEQNYPNPFNPSTTIRYRLSKGSSVSLKVFNTLGQCVAVLADEEKEAGLHRVIWAPNLPTGMYFCRLTVGSDLKTVKLMMLK